MTDTPNFNVQYGIEPDSPLAPLYQSPYSFDSRYYPRDLSSERRGHWINFYINAHKQSKYLEQYQQVGSGLSGAAQMMQSSQGLMTSASTEKQSLDASGLSIAADAAKDWTPSILRSGSWLANETKNTTLEIPALSLGRQTSRIMTAISLYMPDTMNVTYNVDWEDVSLSDALGPLGAIGQIGASFWDKIKSGNAWDAIRTTSSNPGIQAEALGMAANKWGEAIGLGAGASSVAYHALGRALNPQLEVLFKGVNIREFQFDFLFSPFNEDEAGNVKEIIKTLKMHQAPEISGGTSGRYLVPPSEFDIDFIHNGAINKNINKISTCVLTQIILDNAPNGWSTFYDGAPVQTRMTLQFKETEIITKERIVDGY